MKRKYVLRLIYSFGRMTILTYRFQIKINTYVSPFNCSDFYQRNWAIYALKRIFRQYGETFVNMTTSGVARDGHFRFNIWIMLLAQRRRGYLAIYVTCRKRRKESIWNILYTKPQPLIYSMILIAWWRHQMETFPHYRPFVRGINQWPMYSPHRPVRRSFEIFFDLNKRMSKHSRRRWFGTPSRSLWRHCNGK